MVSSLAQSLPREALSSEINFNVLNIFTDILIFYQFMMFIQGLAPLAIFHRIRHPTVPRILCLAQVLYAAGFWIWSFANSNGAPFTGVYAILGARVVFLMNFWWIALVVRDWSSPEPGRPVEIELRSPSDPENTFTDLESLVTTRQPATEPHSYCLHIVPTGWISPRFMKPLQGRCCWGFVAPIDLMMYFNTISVSACLSSMMGSALGLLELVKPPEATRYTVITCTMLAPFLIQTVVMGTFYWAYRGRGRTTLAHMWILFAIFAVVWLCFDFAVVLHGGKNALEVHGDVQILTFAVTLLPMLSWWTTWWPLVGSHFL